MKLRLLALMTASIFGVTACSGGSSSAPADAADPGPGDLVADMDRAEHIPADVPPEADASAPVHPWPLCTAETSTPSLAQKAAGYDELARNLHLADGLLRTVTLKEAGGTEAQSYHHADNANYWTGLYLASQVFRHAATGETQALENALKAARGLHDLAAVTGKEGLLGRCYATPDGLYQNRGEGDPKWHDSTALGYEGWRFKGDVSKDGYSGVMFAYGVVAALAPPGELRDLVAQDALAVARHLMKEALTIIDVTGQMTEHGDLYASSPLGFPGFNAVLAAAFLKVAAVAADDQDVADYYYGCLMNRFPVEPCREKDKFYEDPYVDAMETMMGIYLENCQENFNNFLMSFLSIYSLTRLEEDDELLTRFRNLFAHGMWRPAGHPYPAADQKNPLYAFLFGGGLGIEPDDASFAEAVDQAICNLKRFPASKADPDVAAGDPALEVCRSRGDHPRAANVFMVDERHRDNFVWRLDPFEIPQERTGSKTLVWTPEDYLLPYWLGRYHGFIDETM